MPILYSPEHNRAVIDGYDDAARQGIAALLTAALPGVRIVREEDDASDWFDISDPESLDEAAPQKDDSDEDDGKKPPEKGKKAPPFGKKKDDAEDEPSDADPQALDGQQEPVPHGDYVPTLADVQTAYDVMYARGLHDDDIAEKIFQRFGLQLELDPMGRVLWVPGMADMPLPDAPELKPKIGLQQGHELDFNRVATQGKPTKDDKKDQSQQPAESVDEGTWPQRIVVRSGKGAYLGYSSIGHRAGNVLWSMNRHGDLSKAEVRHDFDTHGDNDLEKADTAFQGRHDMDTGDTSVIVNGRHQFGPKHVKKLMSKFDVSTLHVFTPKDSLHPDLAAEVAESVDEGRAVYHRPFGSGYEYHIHHDGQKVGQAYVSSYRPGAYVLSAIDIDPEHQRQGHGTHLLRHIVKHLRGIGGKTLSSSNEGSGTVQMLDRVFGRKVKHYHRSHDVPVTSAHARHVMDVKFGRTSSRASLESANETNETAWPRITADKDFKKYLKVGFGKGNVLWSMNHQGDVRTHVDSGDDTHNSVGLDAPGMRFFGRHDVSTGRTTILNSGIGRVPLSARYVRALVRKLPKTTTLHVVDPDGGDIDPDLESEVVYEADINPWLWDRYLNKPDKGRRSDRVHVTRTSLTPGKGHPLTHKEPRTSFEREMKMPAHQPERVRWMWHPTTGEMRISHAEEDHHATMLDAGENKHYDQWVRGYYFPKHRKVLIRAHPNPGVGERLVGLLKPHLPASTTYRTNVSTANLQGVDGFARRGF